jgi:hypothetical protein
MNLTLNTMEHSAIEGCDKQSTFSSAMEHSDKQSSTMEHSVIATIEGCDKQFTFSSNFLEEDESFLGTMWKFSGRQSTLILNSISENELHAIHYLYENGMWDSKYFRIPGALTRDRLVNLSDYMCIEPYIVGTILSDGTMVEEPDNDSDSEDNNVRPRTIPNRRTHMIPNRRPLGPVHEENEEENEENEEEEFITFICPLTGDEFNHCHQCGADTISDESSCWLCGRHFN